MPRNDQRYAQKGPTHGGDDDSSGAAAPASPQKGPDLRRYINKPDYNIRDLFWTIMKSYAENKDIKETLKNFYSERLSLMRVAVSVVKQPDRFLTEEMSEQDVATYTIRMIFEEEWEDVFIKLIGEAYERKSGVSLPFLIGMQKNLESPKAKGLFIKYVNNLLLDNFDTEGILAFIAELNIPEITNELKKELLVLAVEGIDQSQHYAIFALAPLVDKDDTVKKSLIMLLRSWDEESRRIATYVLRNCKDPMLLDAAKKQLTIEDNDQIKKVLQEIIKNNEGQV
jgi:hypothetical protein